MTAEKEEKSAEEVAKEKEEALKRQWTEKLFSSESALSRSYRSKTKKTDENKALIRLALHRSPFFTCMDEEQIERFIKVADLRTYAPGEMVILEGKIDEDEDSVVEAHAEEKEAETLEETEETPVKENVKEDTSEYVSIDLEQQNPLEEAASALRTGDEAADVSVVVEEVGPADAEEFDDTFVDDPEPVHKQALKIVAAVADAEDVPIDIEQVSKSAKEKRESMSGTQSYVYVVRSGNADVWHENFNTSSMGPGHIFGEGGFLFHRRHSASVVASPSTELACWVVPINLFMSYVLPSNQMVHMFVKYASRETSSGEPYMTMDDFVRCVTDREGTADDPSAGSRVANTYSILRKAQGTQKINLSDFCLFYLLMARPDPEVDIAFLLMDQSRTGTITFEDFKVREQIHFPPKNYELSSLLTSAIRVSWKSMREAAILISILTL